MNENVIKNTSDLTTAIQNVVKIIKIIDKEIKMKETNRNNEILSVW